MRLLARTTSSPAFQEAIGVLGAWYLKLVWRTSRHIFEPPTLYEQVELPAILAMWHGQHFLTAFIKRPGDRGKVLVSRHRDGEINARVARRLGIGTIRGSGAHNGEFFRKGGYTAFGEMVDALKEGYSVVLTADVPKVSRVAGLGLIKLAQLSGRPIYPVAVASSRRKVLHNWDRTAINLPFSRISLVAAEGITVPPDADDAALESARQMVENELNRITARAYEIADRKGNASL
jgi:hypothetical protein